MEYFSPILDPHLAKDIALLENAEKFGLRVCLKDWSYPYEELLSKAILLLLSQCCSLADLRHMHKSSQSH